MVPTSKTLAQERCSECLKTGFGLDIIIWAGSWQNQLSCICTGVSISIQEDHKLNKEQIAWWCQ